MPIGAWLTIGLAIFLLIFLPAIRSAREKEEKREKTKKAERGTWKTTIEFRYFPS